MALRTLRCAIEQVADWHPRLFLEPHLVGCVAVMSRYSLSELSRRHREKAAQALANPMAWDAYVVVCAFSGEGHRIRFSRERSEESSGG